MPTPLTDAQLDVLFRAALPFQPATRVQFLEAVMSALSQESSSAHSMFWALNRRSRPSNPPLPPHR
jgi:hypothetical protein